MQLFDGAMPLTAYLKKYFSEHKKFGSKDRKNIAHLCYCYYRIGHAGNELAIEERFKIALYLVNDSVDGWEQLYNENWLQNWSDLRDERLHFIENAYPLFNSSKIFPLNKAISPIIPASNFTLSHLIQPDFFIRIRPGKKEAILKQLNTANIPYTVVSETCLSFFSSVKMDAVVAVDRDLVVQDKSSQRISELFAKIERDKTKAIQLWDCCAASGGKTILARDFFGVMDMTVSDIRASILHNLKARFERAGIKYFQSLTTDLSKPDAQKPSGKFDLILADLPCSGSGTWGRTPEQLIFFQENKIQEYTKLQQNIIANIISSVSPNGYLFYSTCSVFKAENEDQKDYILNNFPSFKLVEEKYLMGYSEKADTMYAALFRNHQ